ncbi:hypothetical protein JW933_04925 [candidate division FCPU426 bacterium]|nr:hypothetical protein [candidate division FCPU426 bacterium]
MKEKNSKHLRLMKNRNTKPQKRGHHPRKAKSPVPKSAKDKPGPRSGQSESVECTVRLFDIATKKLFINTNVVIYLKQGGIFLCAGRGKTNDQGVVGIRLEQVRFRLEGDVVLKLGVLDPQGKPGALRTFVFKAGDRGEAKLYLPAPGQIHSSIGEIAARLNLGLDERTVAELQKRRLSTLADIRRQGGSEQLGKILPERSAAALQAMSDLSLVCDEVDDCVLLHTAGYSHPGRIAAAPKDEFVRGLENRMDEEKAEAIHQKAAVRTNYINAVLLGQLADRANRYEKLPGFMQGIELPKPPCECRDCESAVSPLAYLADLLRYAMNYVSLNDKKLEISDLKFLLHQQFDRLPASCESVEKKVRQARIAVEVLRERLAISPPAPEQQEELNKAERAYCLSVYRDLLLRLGTSLDEIRLVHRADMESKQKLADKLALDDISRLEELRLEPEAVNEQKLQTLFGLANTRPDQHDPLADVPTPGIEKWRLNFLTSLWKKEDCPESELDAGQPVIDPDVIGPDDMRWPFADNPFALSVAGNNPNRQYLLWEKRRKWVDARLCALQQIPAITVCGEAVPDLQATLGAMLEVVDYNGQTRTPWQNANINTPAELLVELDVIYAKMSSGSQEAVEEAVQKITGNLAMPVEAFCRLLELKRKQQFWATANSDEKLSREEWGEFISILVQIQKRIFYEAWQEEETGHKITLADEDFWISAQEPAVGAWPPLTLGQEPLVDPEKINCKQLPERKAGVRAREVWERRRDEIAHMADDLRSKLPDVEAALLMAVGNEDDNNAAVLVLPHDMNELKARLASPDNLVVAEAERKIVQDFHMPVEDFSRLLAILAKYVQADPAKKPTESEQKDFIRILVTAQKLKRKYPGWLREEQNVANPLPYWYARKAFLPAWRAGLVQRLRWQNTLRRQCEPPIIDPDLIEAGDLARPVDDDQAFVLWHTRQETLSVKLGQIENKRKQDGLGAVLGEIIRATSQELEALARDEQDGYPIEAYLAQLRLSRPAFAYLLNIIKLLGQNETVHDYEWKEVDAILLQVWKESHFYQWHEQEKNPGLVLSPEHFIVDRLAARDLPKWRARQEMLRKWQDKLEARYDQQAAIRKSIQKAVSDTEALALPGLRDALIKAHPASNENMADILSRRFFISMRESGCQVTTRASQAVVSIQGFLQALRLDHLQSMYPELKLEAPDFNADWKWLGSYATWRAILFVFLYPENLLLPTLLRQPTPIFESVAESLSAAQEVTPEKVSEQAAMAQTLMQTTMKVSIYKVVAVANKILLFGMAWNGDVVWSICTPQNLTNYQLDYAQRTIWSKIPTISGHLAGVISVGTYVYVIATDGLYYDRHIIFTRCGVGSIGIDEERCLPIGEWEEAQAKDIYIDNVIAVGKNKVFIARYNLYTQQISIQTLEIAATGDDWGAMEDCAAIQPGGYVEGLGQVMDDKYFVVGCMVDQRFKYLLYEVSDTNQVSAAVEIFTSGTRVHFKSYLAFTDYTNHPGKQFYALFYKDAQANESDSVHAVLIIKSANGLTLEHDLQFVNYDGVEVASNIVPSNYTLSGLRVLSAAKRPSGVWTLSSIGIAAHTDPKQIGERSFVTLTCPDDLYCFISPRSGNSPASRGVKDYLIAMSGEKENMFYRHVVEACYFLPMYFALQLHQAGYYAEALDWFRSVYDYTAPVAERKIYPGLELEETIETSFLRPDDWLADPLDPHAIAATRANAYTRYTIMSIVQCLLAYADVAFARDTVESLPLAQSLYAEAEELLDSPELIQGSSECDDIMGQLEIDLGILRRSSGALYARIKKQLACIGDRQIRRDLAADIKQILKSNQNLSTAISQIWNLLEESSRQTVVPVAGIIGKKAETIKKLQEKIMASDAVFENALAMNHLGQMGPAWQEYFPDFLLSATFGFCIPRNPIADILRTKVRINLCKLRNCQNIAGMTRAVAAFAAATDTQTGMPYLAGGQIVLPGISAIQPSQYRYRTLMARAKQLLDFAQQMENSLLAAMEKEAQATYSIMKARQEMDMAKAGVKLQELRIKEAEIGVELAETQKISAEIRADYYQGLIDAGWTTLENAALDLQITVASMQETMALGYGIGSFWNAAAALEAAQMQIAALQTTAGVLATYASYERRQQEWGFQLSMSRNDVVIGGQQIKLAEAHVGISKEEKHIAEISVQNAEDTLEFLRIKFDTPELYRWMGNTLRQIYAYFLQQATAMAQTASRQLEFERHEIPPPFIQTDYWETTNQALVMQQAGQDEKRQGLLGAERLALDLEKLDLYAFKTDERRLHLAKKISLAALSPWEFARFRETGLMLFATPMELFDRDHPGHYMRLIHHVKVTVVGLISPAAGIHATLTSDRISRVVIGGDLFQITQIAHGPNQVALSSPQEATGIFELDPQTEILRPFEGIGVDTHWEFCLPKASNLIDYSAIADVIITLEYTALNSFDFKHQVIDSLPARFSADRAFSFKYNLPDQWYQFNNPEQSATPMCVCFKTKAAHFPPNLDNFSTADITLYFSGRAGFEVRVEQMLFKEQGQEAWIGGGANTVEKRASTRSSNGAAWQIMQGKLPFGEWRIELQNTLEMRRLFREGEITDVLFIISYEAYTPEWVK